MRKAVNPVNHAIRKLFKSIKDMLMHVKQVHGENIACTMCDKLFVSEGLSAETYEDEKKLKTKHHLKTHETSHYPDKFTFIYNCNICRSKIVYEERQLRNS